MCQILPCPFFYNESNAFLHKYMITYFDRQFFGSHQWKSMTVGYVCMKEEGYSPTFVTTGAPKNSPAKWWPHKIATGSRSWCYCMHWCVSLVLVLWLVNPCSRQVKCGTPGNRGLWLICITLSVNRNTDLRMVPPSQFCSIL